ncbi:MAG: hypothetical protein A2297_01755 [Elusimicrobia bacterium RIFOXYB2_FULL_48_7]|nr:MAG: hypothetical protein A2297_01755 [Elusimicrobia bacterium RIFOXYB2_FULL_48_7]
MIFHDEQDLGFFKKLLLQNKFLYGLKIYHYVLMSNHVHLILRAHEGKNLSDAIKRINVTYTVYYRKRYEGVGHFFQDRFKSCLIQDGKYLLECGKYIELNPVRAGIVSSPGEYKWSSYRVYSGETNGTIVDFSPEFDGLGDNPEQRVRAYERYVNEGTIDLKEDDYFRKGAYGSSPFVENLVSKGLKPASLKEGRPWWKNQEITRTVPVKK